MKNTVATICIMLCIGCGASSTQSGVIRTDLSEWETVEIPAQGISIEIPKEAFNFQMHHHPNFLCDSVWMLSVHTEKETPQERAKNWKPSPENPASSDQNYMAWLKWTHDLHTADTSTWETGNRREYRHDITNTDGTIIRIHIEYVFSCFTPEQQAKDVAAINRIIRSVKTIKTQTPDPAAPRPQGTSPDK